MTGNVKTMLFMGIKLLVYDHSVWITQSIKPYGGCLHLFFWSDDCMLPHQLLETSESLAN